MDLSHGDIAHLEVFPHELPDPVFVGGGHKRRAAEVLHPDFRLFDQMRGGAGQHQHGLVQKQGGYDAVAGVVPKGQGKAVGPVPKVFQ